MTGDHHGQTASRATLLVRAADEILGTHTVSPSRFPPSGPTKSFSHRMFLPGFCAGRSPLGAAGSRDKT
jgi:hypothetical protein